MDDLPNLRAVGLAPESLSDRWKIVAGTQEAADLEGELRREITSGHLLHGAEVVGVAVHVRRKESIFWVQDRARWAWVHLTWTVESDPRWPDCVVCDTWVDLVAELVECWARIAGVRGQSAATRSCEQGSPLPSGISRLA